MTADIEGGEGANGPEKGRTGPRVVFPFHLKFKNGATELATLTFQTAST